MAETGRFSLTGKTAIVTGASSGLGVTMAEALAEAGANVVIAARRVENLEALASRIEGAGGKAMAYRCDVSDSSSVRDLVAAAWEAFGRVDVLVNNAGVSAEAGVMPEKTPDELFAQTIQTNLMGTFYACREVGSRQLADGRGGSLINVSSIMGMAGQQNAPVAYQASKAAVINLTRNLALSWADRGVRVNCIAPGWFPSEMTELVLAAPPFRARIDSQAALGRAGRPEELVGPLLLLASDASSYMTGSVLVVDGGTSATVGAAPYDEELFGLHEAVMPHGLGTRVVPA